MKFQNFKKLKYNHDSPNLSYNQMSEKNSFDLSTLSHEKCLLVKESGKMEVLEFDKDSNTDFIYVSEFLKKNLNCDLFQIVPSKFLDVDIWIDDIGKINKKSILNKVASDLFDIKREIPNDEGLYGNVLFTKKGTIP